MDFESKAIDQLRTMVMALPEVEDGSSCHKLAFKARKKAFLYVGSKDDRWTLMLKLTDSVEEVDGVASKAKDLSVSEYGWVGVTFGKDVSAPGELAKWEEESYRALAPKALV